MFPNMEHKLPKCLNTVDSNTPGNLLLIAFKLKIKVLVYMKLISAREFHKDFSYY